MLRELKLVDWVTVVVIVIMGFIVWALAATSGGG